MMLCVDQTKRWTAEQLLKHPWITMGDETLEAKDLTNSIVVLKKFNARRRLRAAADAVIMANRMNRMLGRFRGSGDENSTSAPVQKKVSLLDPDALQAVQEGTAVSTTENADAEDFNRLRTRLSFDTSDQTSDESSLHPALDLLYDKDLEGA
jgi:hypothetical protein